jgi:toxin FitB
VRTLLDTNVISELQKVNGSRSVRNFIEELPDEELWLSVVTIGELTKGIARLAAGKRRLELEQWLSSTESLYRQRIVSVDLETARIWGSLAARLEANGMNIPVTDGLIAATAVQHEMRIATRDTGHYSATGVPLVNPWESNG